MTTLLCTYYTFMSLVSGFALRARLIPILPLIFIARPANWKCADIASNKRLTINSQPYIITTDLTDLAPYGLQGLSLATECSN